MSPRYEKDFRLGRYDGYEEIVIPAAFPRAGILALVGLSLWPLPFVLKAGIPMLITSQGKGLGVLVVFWIVPVVVCAITQIAWWLGGAERLVIIGGDLLLRHTIAGVPIATWSFRGGDIRFLAPVDVPPTGWLTGPALPFLSSHAAGRLKFFYKERTVYLGTGLTPAAAHQACDWLRRRLPPRASEPSGEAQSSLASASSLPGAR